MYKPNNRFITCLIWVLWGGATVIPLIYVVELEFYAGKYADMPVFISNEMQGDMIKEGQVIGYIDQFGTQLPVKVSFCP